MTIDSEWKLSTRYREVLASLILIPVGYTFLKDPFLSGTILSNLKTNTGQIFMQFLISASLFGYGILQDKPKEWIFWAGVSGIPTGVVLVIDRVTWIAQYADVSLDGEYLQLVAASGVVPVISLAGTVLYLFLSRDVQLESNRLVERFSAIAGLIFTLMMLWGQYLPWERRVFSSTNSNWKFKGSGSQLLIEECCYLTGSGWNEGLLKVIPLVFLLAFLLLRVLGYHFSNLGFLGLLLWGIFETVGVVDGTGLQDPKLAGWSEAEISSYGLRYEIEIAFGGYLFAFAFVGLILILLLPRAIQGRTTNSSHQ